MCGIIGILDQQPVADMILDGLRRLEYRGYDSAGIATLTNGHIHRVRAEGKLINLQHHLQADPSPGHAGIGHTRWATHGAPTEANAHPHASDRVALVHNGIIENFQDLKSELIARGSNFHSDTDTEVVVHLITAYIKDGMTPIDAAAAALKRLEGAFALAIIFAGEHNLMVGARKGSPLVVGYGEDAMYLGSDAIALAPWTQKICYLEEGDWVVLHRDGAEIRDEQDTPVAREIKQSQHILADVSKGNHRHYMLKEIYEQPAVIGDTIHPYVHPDSQTISFPELPFQFSDIPKLTIVACGTSYYSALIAKYWFEQIAKLAVDVDIASEFRYRGTPLPTGGAGLFISQSGETMDTLQALRLARAQDQHILSLVNVPESTMARESDVTLLTRAGPEIGVASTKAFTTQLAMLACLVMTAAKQRGVLNEAQEAELTQALVEVPSRAAEVVKHDELILQLAQDVVPARDVLYIGRGAAFPIALEGALKLKEISYIHAEGYAAGELKHGPIALVDEHVPIVAVVPKDDLFDKTASNIQEVAARGGRVLLLSDKDGIESIGDNAYHTVELPVVHPFVAPILYAIPVQLLAYHVAVLKGTDVDQPRNLAKSVTVE